MRLSPRSRFTALALAVALTTGTLTTVASAATAASATDTRTDGVVASGDTWTVTDLGGTYRVVLDLAQPLPIRDDAPTLVVDGAVVGLAQESSSGRRLTVLTDDPAVATASSVRAGWFSQAGTTGATVTDVEPAPEPELLLENAPEGTPDPSVHGDYAYTKSLYSFGNQAIALAGIGGIRGEVEGKVYLPTTGGARPVVLFLHGRHTSCNGPGANPLRWPCGATQTNIPSYAGYDGAAEALASNGYAVISIAANAVNSNDNELALDQGAQARGRLILDTLAIFRDANAGVSTTLHDAQTDTDVTLADAMSGNGGLPAAGLDPEIVEIAPADLVGRLDFSSIGLMGHSRGGEGVTAAATLNAQLADPFEITSILPLAPVDFGRMTVPSIPSMVLLPYCDGDVSNQQGQHMNDDARYAFDDDVLRSDVWVMGANHNFFNTVWTPGKYPLSVSDDWSGTSTTSARATDSVCGTQGAAVDTSIRLTADEQYDVGTALLAGWFRLTVGGEDEFLPMFDGSNAKVDSTADADIRVSATQPAGSRGDIETFTEPGSSVRTYGTATATLCASLSGRTLPATLPFCSTTLASAQVPHWTPASNGANVPASPMNRMLWTSGTGELRMTIPRTLRDASAWENLSIKVAPDESVAYGQGTDLTLTVVDRVGATFSTPVSALNPNALVRLPQSTQNPTTLGKIVLQQVKLPVADITGVDVTDLREVRLTAAVGIDGLVTGGAYLSDLAFETPAVGTADAQPEVAVGTGFVRVEEGVGPGEALVPVTLSRAAAAPVTAYVTVAGGTTATSKAALAMKKITFAPGQTCTTVPVATYGDVAASASASTAYKISVTNTSGAVMGSSAFAQLVVREDDGATGSAQPIAPVGEQGDPCVEVAPTAGTLDAGSAPVAPGGTVTVTGSGFRAFESVAFSLDGVSLGSAVSAADGSVSAELVVPAGATLGERALTAVAAGTGRTARGTVTVLAPTSTELALAPALPAIGEPVTLTATVTGADTAGEVTFHDGATILGTSQVVDGVATLTLPGGFAAGEHAVGASFGATGTAAGSTSEVVTFLLVKGASTIALTLDAAATEYGAPVSGSVQVGGSGTGTVTLAYGGTTKQLVLAGGSATFALPATLAPGTYTLAATFDGTDQVAASGTVTAEVTVAQRATTATVSVPGSVTVGGKVSGTVTVSGATAGTAPTGTVTVQVKKGTGAWTTATTVALRGSGTAAFSVTAPATATGLSVRARYAGDGTYAASTSASDAVRVAKKVTTTTVKAPARAKLGAAIPVTVTVRPTASTAGGTVRVYTRQGSGAWALVRTATLGAGGTVTVSVKGKAVGGLDVKAVLSSTGALAASTGTAAITITR